jgi:phage terminase large subunit
VLKDQGFKPSDIKNVARVLAFMDDGEISDINVSELTLIEKTFLKAYQKSSKKGDFRYIKDIVGIVMDDVSNSSNNESEPTTLEPHIRFMANMMNPLFTSRVFRKIWDFLNDESKNAKRILNSYGGTRSTKSYSNIQASLALSYVVDNKRIVICRRTVKLLKKTIQNDVNEIIRLNELGDDFEVNKTDRIYTNKKTGTRIELCAYATAEDAGGDKINILVMDEAPEMPFALFEQLFLRLAPGGKVILSHNPVSEFSWTKTEIADNPHRDDVLMLVSTYKDNRHLKEEQIKGIELLQHTNPQLWKILGLGQYGIIEGLVFPNIHKCTTAEFDKVHSGKMAFGVDWGFNDPTTVICVKYDSAFNILYLKELDYFTKDEYYIKTALKTVQNSKYYSKRVPTIIDHKPEAKRVFETQKVWAENAQKGAGSIKGGIDLMNNCKIVITDDSYNLLKEFSTYSFQQDKNGHWMDSPVDFMNHGIDASRYASRWIFMSFKIDFGIKR